MQLLSRTEFAVSRGWSRQYVGKLAKQGRLVISPDGKVDVEATEALLHRTADPSKASVAERHQRERVQRHVSDYIAQPDPPQEAQPLLDTGDVVDFQKSRALREYFAAQLTQNEARKSNGELVERQAVENAAFATGRMLRDLLLGLPKQISPGLAAINDPWELERQLTAHLRRVLDDASRMSQSDLESALQPPN